jgi:ABC-type glycerol-3-phosphate transport system substrate-binding protein
VARTALERATTTLKAGERALSPAVLTVLEHDTRPTDHLAWAAMRAAFTGVYPSVAIEHDAVPWESARATPAALPEQPDLPTLGRLASIADLAAAGRLIPLEELISAEEQRRVDARVGYYRWDSLFAAGPDRTRRLYGLPYASATQAMLFNQAIFAAEGIKLEELAAWNWDDLEKLCAQLSRPDRPALALAGVNSPATARLLHLIVRAFGGGLVRGRYVDHLKPAKLTLSSPETIAGLRAFVALYRKGYLQPSAPTDGDRQRDALFAAGKAAMLPASTWDLAVMRDALTARGAGLGTLSLPRGPNNLHTTLETAVGGLFTGARTAGRLLPALELLAFLSSEAGTRLFTLVSGALPAADALLKEGPWATEPVYRGFMDGLLFLDRPAPPWMSTAPETVLATTVAGFIPGLLTMRLLPEEAARLWEQALYDALDRLGIKTPR